MMRNISFFVCLAALLTARSAQAGILTAEYESQVESWLGAGDQDFTQIYEKAPGDDAAHFHAAVDGMGRNIVLVNVYDNNGVLVATVGGYNPRSWQDFGGYNFTETDPERNGFIFNLTTSTRQLQVLTTDGPFGAEWGKSQTFNSNLFGPAFGAGRDLSVFDHADVPGESLDTIQFVQYSYGVPGINYGHGINLLGNTGWTTLRAGEIEVYTFAEAAPPPEELVTEVNPEPASLVLWGLGAIGCTVAGYRKRKAVA